MHICLEEHSLRCLVPQACHDLHGSHTHVTCTEVVSTAQKLWPARLPYPMYFNMFLRPQVTCKGTVLV